jgi:hypothetical protein
MVQLPLLAHLKLRALEPDYLFLRRMQQRTACISDEILKFKLTRCLASLHLFITLDVVLELSDCSRLPSRPT